MSAVIRALLPIFLFNIRNIPFQLLLFIEKIICAKSLMVTQIIDLTNKKCLPPAKEKGIKAPGKNSGVTFLSLAGISLYQNRQFFWLRFNARAAPSQDQSQWHLQQAHLYSGGTASAYTDFSIKLSHLFLLFSY